MPEKYSRNAFRQISHELPPGASAYFMIRQVYWIHFVNLPIAIAIVDGTIRATLGLKMQSKRRRFLSIFKHKF